MIILKVINVNKKAINTKAIKKLLRTLKKKLFVLYAHHLRNGKTLNLYQRFFVKKIQRYRQLSLEIIICKSEVQL